MHLDGVHSVSSGRDKGAENALVFVAWMASKTDEDFRALVGHKGVLSRGEIAKECGFKSAGVLYQNPGISGPLSNLENDLRERGVLPAAVEARPKEEGSVDEFLPPPVRDTGRVRVAQAAERLRRLEQENASMKAEIAELKRVVEKFTVLREALLLTGRVPR